MTWEMLRFTVRGEEVAKTHLAPGPIVDAVRNEVVTRIGRGPLVIGRSAVQPGMAADFRLGPIGKRTRTSPFDPHAPKEAFDLDGLGLEVPSRDVGELVQHVDLLPERELPGGVKYVKLHGWMLAIAMQPAQAAALLAALGARAAGAARRFVEYEATAARRRS